MTDQARRKQSRSGPAVIQACSKGSGGMLPLENFEEMSVFLLTEYNSLDTAYAISEPTFIYSILVKG